MRRHHLVDHALVLEQLVERAGAHGGTQSELELLVQVVDRLRLLREGRLTFPEIDLKESELAGAGLKYLPAEG